MAWASLFRPHKNLFWVVGVEKIFCELHYTLCSNGSCIGLARKAEDSSKSSLDYLTEGKLCLSGIKRIVILEFLQ